MKLPSLTSVILSALLLVCAAAQAQTRVIPSTDTAATATAPTATQPDASAHPAPDPDEPTAGHDEITGNDQVNPNNSVVQHGVGSHPDFQTLDINNRGFLTADDVKGNDWLSRNFSRCDSNHDGQLSPQEYANCH